MLTKKFIRDKAREILNEFEVQGPPVPIREIVEGHALKVEEFMGPDNEDGALIPQRRCIRLNTRKPQTRQRFTLAHELGHWVLYHQPRVTEEHRELDGIRDNREDFEVSLDSMRPHKVREREANIFAAELLMPASWLKADWKKTKDMGQLTKKYQVSEQALWIRAEEVGIV